MWKLDLKDMTNMTSFCGEWLELGVCIHIIHVHRHVNVYTEDLGCGLASFQEVVC